MNQEQARETLPLYADGELDPQRAAELEVELAKSAEFRDELERWQALRCCAYRVLTAPSAPATLEAAIRRKIRGRSAQTGLSSLWIFGGITTIAAAVALLVVFWPSGTAGAGPKLVNAEEFARIYRGCARDRRHRGVEVDLTDLDAARQQLASMTLFPVLIPDLGAQGFQLDGICRCFHVEGVHVVHAFYRQEGQHPSVLSLFSVDQQLKLESCEHCPSRRGSPRDYEVGQCQDVLVCKWDETGNSFAVCGEMTQTQLRELADGIPVVAYRVAPAVFVRAD